MITVDDLTDEMVRALRDELPPWSQTRKECDVALGRGPTAGLARRRIAALIEDRRRAAENDDVIAHQRDGRFGIDTRAEARKG